MISAFIKSMRAGQTEDALYYLARMWEGGEDPLFIARRMVIFHLKILETLTFARSPLQMQ